MHAVVDCVYNICGSAHSSGCMVNGSFARAFPVPPKPGSYLSCNSRVLITFLLIISTSLPVSLQVVRVVRDVSTIPVARARTSLRTKRHKSCCSSSVSQRWEG